MVNRPPLKALEPGYNVPLYGFSGDKKIASAISSDNTGGMCALGRVIYVGWLSTIGMCVYGRDVVSVSACERNKVRGKALELHGVRCQFVLFVYFF